MYGNSLVGLTVGYIIAILIFYSFVYRPAIMQMDKDMRRTRSMLLVFPDEVRAVMLVLGPGVAQDAHSP